MKNLLLTISLLCVAFCNSLLAQSVNDEYELRAFARDFMAAYNRQDVDALQAMYTADAVSINGETQLTGAESIAKSFVETFIKNEVTLLVRQTRVSWSDAQHAWVVMGTFESFGNTLVYDIPFQNKASFSNTMLKENGSWKIDRSVLSPIVKTMTLQKVADVAAWKSAFDQVQMLREANGEQSCETGTLQDDATTVYVIQEWLSMESADDFFANPDLAKAMKEAGIREKPTILRLE